MPTRASQLLPPLLLLILLFSLGGGLWWLNQNLFPTSQRPQLVQALQKQFTETKNQTRQQTQNLQENYLQPQAAYFQALQDIQNSQTILWKEPDFQVVRFHYQDFFALPQRTIKIFEKQAGTQMNYIGQQNYTWLTFQIYQTHREINFLGINLTHATKLQKNQQTQWLLVKQNPNYPGERLYLSPTPTWSDTNLNLSEFNGYWIQNLQTLNPTQAQITYTTELDSSPVQTQTLTWSKLKSISPHPKPNSPK